MAKRKKQDGITGSGHIKTPILAQGKDPTEAQSKPSLPLTSIGDLSTKPRSVAEGLSLLQTNCFDLRSLDCEVSILARGRRIYIIAAIPPDTGKLEMEDGHITIAGKPVLLG